MLEQDLANWLLVSPHAAHTQLNWTLIPDELATANLSRVGPRTVAFHAVGVTGEAKFKRLWQGYKLAGPERRVSLERQHCNGAGGRVGGRVGGSSRGMTASIRCRLDLHVATAAKAPSRFCRMAALSFWSCASSAYVRSSSALEAATAYSLAAARSTAASVVRSSRPSRTEVSIMGGICSWPVGRPSATTVRYVASSARSTSMRRCASKSGNVGIASRSRARKALASTCSLVFGSSTTAAAGGAARPESAAASTSRSTLRRLPASAAHEACGGERGAAAPVVLRERFAVQARRPVAALPAAGDSTSSIRERAAGCCAFVRANLTGVNCT
eukprot:scaffold53436_cov60-Phaeocystis_antarctica.AAC.6